MSSVVVAREHPGSGGRGFPDIREIAFLRARVAKNRADAATDAGWEHLLHNADQHGLIPLLYRSTDPSLLPDTALSLLRRMFDANARKALWLTGELLRIVDALDAHGIPAIPYKGPVLAELLYGNVAMRQFSDLDILVPPADVPSAKETLVSLGYSVGLKLTSREERAHLASGYEYTFDNGHGRNLVEIQWRVVPRFYAIDFDMEAIFQRAAITSFQGKRVRSLAPEDLFLILSVHAAKHRWAQLSWLRDITELARSQRLDWDFIHRQSRALGIERIMQVTLWLAERSSGGNLASAAGDRFPPDPEAALIGSEILGALSNENEHDTESPAYFRFMMRLRERRQDRLHFLHRLALTPSVGEWRAVQLPEALFPLYGAIRFFRLARRMTSLAAAG